MDELAREVAALRLEVAKLRNDLRWHVAWLSGLSGTVGAGILLLVQWAWKSLGGG